MDKKSFLEELQSLDDSAKAKVLVVSTVIIMIVVIYFWIGYFGSIISNAPQSVAGAEGAAAGGAQADQPGFLQNVAGGMASMFRSFGRALGSPREYEVQPQ